MIEKTPESNVTRDIIQKVHLALANIKSGEDVLKFLKETEPIFMHEVSRFVHTELYRLKFNMPEEQAFYLGSVIGAAYIAGFLIAREGAHKMYNGLMNMDSPVNKVLKNEDIDKLIDKFSEEGKTPSEIGKAIRKHLNLNKGNKKHIAKNGKKRLNIDDLGL